MFCRFLRKRSRR